MIYRVYRSHVIVRDLQSLECCCRASWSGFGRSLVTTYRRIISSFILINTTLQGKKPKHCRHFSRPKLSLPTLLNHQFHPHAIIIPWARPFALTATNFGGSQITNTFKTTIVTPSLDFASLWFSVKNSYAVSSRSSSQQTEWGERWKRWKQKPDQKLDKKSKRWPRRTTTQRPKPYT